LRMFERCFSHLVSAEGGSRSAAWTQPGR
jgi:hypothetical protein